LFANLFVTCLLQHGWDLHAVTTSLIEDAVHTKGVKDNVTALVIGISHD
jgi:hypothetical protein